MTTRLFTLILILITSFQHLYSQSPGVYLTPKGNLSLKPQKIKCPAKWRGLVDTTRMVNLPDGFIAQFFYATKADKKLRFMAFDPKGVLHIACYNQNKIMALPDINKDGIADDTLTVATGIGIPHDVDFYNGALYATDTTKIWKFTDNNADGIYETKTTFFNIFPNGTKDIYSTRHKTRTLVFDSLNKKAYLSVGSFYDIGRESSVELAAILEVDDNGTNKKVYATGVRNAVGMALHPVTNRLWANNNGSTKLGNNLPLEWVDIIRKNGYYGYPIAHDFKIYNDFSVKIADSDYTKIPPITPTDSNNVDKMIKAAAFLPAHFAPMALTFAHPSYPVHLRKGLFSVSRGTHSKFDRTYATGHRISYIDLSNDTDTTANFVADFMTGFLYDSVSVNGNNVFTGRWARPVGLVINKNGDMYLGSDAINQFIIKISYDPITNIDKEALNNQLPVIQYSNQTLRVKADPNFSYQCFITNRMGQTILNETMIYSNTDYTINNLPSGVYIIKISRKDTYLTKKIVVE